MIPRSHTRLLRTVVIPLAAISLCSDPANANSITNFFKKLAGISKEAPKPHAPEPHLRPPEITPAPPIDATTPSGSGHYFYFMGSNNVRRMVEKIRIECAALKKDDVIVVNYGARASEDLPKLSPWLYEEDASVPEEALLRVVQPPMAATTCVATAQSSDGRAQKITSNDIIYLLPPNTGK